MRVWGIPTIGHEVAWFRSFRMPDEGTVAEGSMWNVGKQATRGEW